MNVWRQICGRLGDWIDRCPEEFAAWLIAIVAVITMLMLSMLGALA